MSAYRVIGQTLYAILPDGEIPVRPATGREWAASLASERRGEGGEIPARALSRPVSGRALAARRAEHDADVAATWRVQS